MILFTIFGLSPLQWFLFVDLPLSIIFIIIIAVKFPKIKAWFIKRRALKSFIKYEYDEDGEDFIYDPNDELKHKEALSHLEKVNEAFKDTNMRTANEKRIDTMMKKYGVPYAFLLKKHKE